LNPDPTLSDLAARPADPAVTLRVYPHAMRRDDGDKEALSGSSRAGIGTIGHQRGSMNPSEPVREVDPENDASAGEARHSEDDGRGWFRTSDLSRVK